MMFLKLERSKWFFSPPLLIVRHKGHASTSRRVVVHVNPSRVLLTAQMKVITIKWPTFQQGRVPVFFSSKQMSVVQKTNVLPEVSM